jgi:type III restriction enzyme
MSLKEGQNFEVNEPILNSPFEEPRRYWFIQEGHSPEVRDSRRPATVFPPKNQKERWDGSDGTLRDSSQFRGGYELVLVNLIRERVHEWRRQGYPGVTRTTLELLQYWQRDGRQQRLFYAQLEAAEALIFLREGRQDLLQGIKVPWEKMPPGATANGEKGFLRLATKMATGSGKSTVMAMLISWSILNKVNSRQDGRFSDVVLVVCPNVTIRDRLRELDPAQGEASIYRVRDLIPPHLMPSLNQGRILVTNWHVFYPQSVQVGGTSSKVVKAGIPVRTTETIHIASKNENARGTKYMTRATLEALIASDTVKVVSGSEEYDKDGHLKKIKIQSTYYVESDTALVNRVLGREVGGKQNILVLNDESHHAYRIHQEKDEHDDDEEDADEIYKEAAVWIEGLDKINNLRGINFCVDLSATPYFLGRAGQDTNRPFPWLVSDFGLIEAIESGLVKIPQMAVRDTTGKPIPSYFNIWEDILKQMTPAERGGRKGSVKPEAVLKYAHTPIAMLGGLWEQQYADWKKNDLESRPPVFIIVCKNTQIAKVMYAWIAHDERPTGIPSAKIKSFLNKNGEINTIRVDSKVVHETDTGNAKADEQGWMRFTLDTVGKRTWPKDSQGRSVYPVGFRELADKLGRPLDPPGSSVRCIVSVGMLTEGWDCNTVTHIIGLRPFMSQLLCEQVVGRGLRRASYELTDGNRFAEEVAKVFGVPFEIIPFKSNSSHPPSKEKRNHVAAIQGREALEIRFPRVERYSQAIRNKVQVDWNHIPSLTIQPNRIPPMVEMKGVSYNTEGRMSLCGPGQAEDVDLNAFRSQYRLQNLIFDLAKEITRYFIHQGKGAVPAHVLFPQMLKIVEQYTKAKVKVDPPSDIKDLFLAPYYGWFIEMLLENIRPDTSQGETPEIAVYEKTRSTGSTAEVDFWTSKPIYDVTNSHLNAIVADTKRWEQTAAFYIDKHKAVQSFVKNAGLGFAVPYLFNGQGHDYEPDFIIRLKGFRDTHLILETKGYDERREVKAAAAQRWCSAVNAEGSQGHWHYRMTESMAEVPKIIDQLICELR